MTKKKETEGKEFSFGIKDRLMIPQLTPTNGNYLDLLTAKHIDRKVEFSSEELEKYNIRSGGNGGIIWDFEKEEQKKIFLTTLEISLLQKQIEELGNQNKLHKDMVDTLEKIMN